MSSKNKTINLLKETLTKKPTLVTTGIHHVYCKIKGHLKANAACFVVSAGSPMYAITT